MSDLDYVTNDTSVDSLVSQQILEQIAAWSGSHWSRESRNEVRMAGLFSWAHNQCCNCQKELETRGSGVLRGDTTIVWVEGFSEEGDNFEKSNRIGVWKYV